jgi:hypothetical protein
MRRSHSPSIAQCKLLDVLAGCLTARRWNDPMKLVFLIVPIRQWETIVRMGIDDESDQVP